MDLVYIAGLAIASSVDNLAVGLSYGLSGIRIGTLANLIIAVVCFILSISGGYFGVALGAVLPTFLTGLIGALALFAIGVRVLVIVLRDTDAATRALSGHRNVGVREAVVLGLALSANALVNAVGGGLLNISPIFVALGAALGSFASIAVGLWIGRSTKTVRIGSFELGRITSFAGGSLLIAMAVVKLVVP